MFSSRMRGWCTALLCFGGGAAALLAVGNPGEAQQKHPAEEKGAKSVKGDFPTSTVRFVNNGAEAVKVFWLDYEGKRVLQARLESGDTFEVAKAQLHHPYVVTDAKDNALGLYFADAQARTVTLGGGFAGGKGGGGKAGGGMFPAPGGLGGLGGFKGAGVSSTFKGLQDPLVQEEIKLSKDQLTKLAELVKKDTEARDALKKAGLTAAATRIKITQIVKDNDAAAEKLLTPAQNTRIAQIKHQHPIAAIWTDTNLMNLLKLTAEQSTQVAAFRAESSKQVLNAAKKFGAGDAQYNRELAAIRANLYAQAEAMLDANQRKAWQDYVGEPCKNYLPPAVFTELTTADKGLKGGGFGKGGGPAGGFGGVPRARDFTVGSSIMTINRFLGEKSVQDDLKLTAEQIQKVGVLPKLGAGRAAPEWLTAAQEKRLRGIYLQQIIAGYGPAGAFRYSDVVNIMNLSAEQRQQIVALGNEDAVAIAALVKDGTPAPADKVRAIDKSTQEKLDKVLNAEQKAKLKDFIGEPFKGALDNPFASPLLGQGPDLREAPVAPKKRGPNRE